MKTGLEWFNFLSENEQEEFRSNAKSFNKYLMKREFSSFRNFIRLSFTWKNTPQGHQYWKEISIRKITPKTAHP
jgi:hypothetical protein